MRVNLIVDFSADGYESEDDEFDCLKVLLEDLDSAAVTVRILKMEKIQDAGNDNV